MSDVKIIKTVFEGNKSMVACVFDKYLCYEKFVEAAKITYRLPDRENVKIFTQDFKIEPELFSIIVEQYINTVDFIIEIKRVSCPQENTANVELVYGDSQDSLVIPETPPADEDKYFTEITLDSSTCQLKSYSTVEEIFLADNNIENLPSTQELRKLLEVQEALQTRFIENKHRTNIAKGIISLALKDNPDRKIIRQDFLQLAQSIIDIFPTEAKETYYVPFTNGHLARGKLYDAYNNKRSRLSAAGIIRRRPKATTEDCLPIKKRFSSNDDSTFVADSELDVLKLENYSDWNIVIEKWKNSYSHRQQELSSEGFTTAEYFLKYKILLNIKSYELISIDFFILHPHAKAISEWKKYYTKVIERSQKLKDMRVCEILQLIKSSDEENKIALSLLLIAYNLPNCRQQSKCEIQQSFIYYCKNILTADEEIRSRVKHLKTESQPKIYFIGDAKKIISLAYVEICGRRLKFENPLQAVEVCFQCFITINIKYPKYSTHVWLFVQQLIFGVKTPWDAIIPSVSTLIKELRTDI